MIKPLALWLCRVAGVQPVIGPERIANGGDAVARGDRWQSFYSEEGGLADMIAAIRKGYFEAAAGLGISETDKVYEYALADRIAREIDREAQKIIISGKIEADRIAQSARMHLAVINR